MPDQSILLYRAAQVRELDRRALAALAVDGYALMRRAGAALFGCLCERWPKSRKLAVFCGAGNNGGDGYVAALLALQKGLAVTVYTVPDEGVSTAECAAAREAYLQARGRIETFLPGRAIDADLIVDALFGTGLTRPIAGAYADAVDAVNTHGAPVAAADIPSGLNADTGMIMAKAVKAACTITFIGLKQGLYTGDAADYCGEVVYRDLGVPAEIFRDLPPAAKLLTKPCWPPRRRTAHKGDFGHVLIVGGDLGYSGAARMAGEAALRVGAGLVTVATRPEHAALMNTGRPELMCRGVDGADALAPLLAKADAAAVGPGLGQGPWAQALFTALLDSDLPLVVDADALNLLAHFPCTQTRWILTPHPGEAGRLLQCSAADVQRDRFAAADRLRQKYGGVTVLKGAGSLVASADGIAVNAAGNPGMASGGMGDVLAGVIGSLLAQNFSLQEAARAGVYGHGHAADLAAAADGERGLLAGDLMPYLRRWANS